MKYLVNQSSILSILLVTNGMRDIGQELPEISDLRGSFLGCIRACFQRG